MNLNCKKIGILTGTRADYGILKPLIRKIDADEKFEMILIVTGMHLEEKYGRTCDEIINDGFKIKYKIPMLLQSDSEKMVINSMTKEFLGVAEVFEAEKLDLLILLGDRFECLVAAVVAQMYRIPIAHIHGGELTEGAIDEAIRHSITKMSILHFAATEEYRLRIIQMGEHPHNVYNVGSMGVESIKTLSLLSRQKLVNKYGYLFNGDYIMITYHPVTLEERMSERKFCELLEVISRHKEYNYVFTYANADPDGNIINKLIESYVNKNTNAIAFKSMGQIGYLSALQYAKMVMGNSSSGIIEAPSFGIPTINIGDRQRGRCRAKTIIDCMDSAEQINAAMEYAKSNEFINICNGAKNPYEQEASSQKIVDVIRERLEEGINIKKTFFDIKNVI